MIAWPLVKAWIAETAPTLPAFSGAHVLTGLPTTRSSAAKYLVVGAVMEEDNAGSYQRSPAYDGTVWTETGEVRSMIVAQSGQGDDSDNEAAAFAMIEALDEAAHADNTLGGVLSAETLIETSVDVLAISNLRGTATALVHVLRYTTTT